MALSTKQTVTRQIYQDNFGAYDEELNKSLPLSWPTKMRAMRREPTIKLVRMAAMAPPMMTSWAIEADNDVSEEIISATNNAFQQHRTHLIRTGLMGCIDWGWQGYEKIFEQKDDYVCVKTFKPLLQDITDILITDNGTFAGFRQDNLLGSDVDVLPENSLLFNIDKECDYHYGEAVMFSAESAYDDKILVNKAAQRYDQKIAGAHWVVHYPIGSSIRGTEEIDNYDIAIEILDNLESSGRMAVPRKLSGMFTGLDAKSSQNIDAWDIELITAYGSQIPFNERMMYLDNLLVRAFGFPERAILQGQFGTKAEAGEHGTFAIVNVQLRHENLVEQLNWYCVNQFLRINFGQEYENKVRFAAAPLADFQQQMLKDLYSTILKNPVGFAAELENIDMTALRDKLDVPYNDGAGNISATPGEVEEPNTEDIKVVEPTEPEDSISTPEQYSTLVGELLNAVS